MLLFDQLNAVFDKSVVHVNTAQILITIARSDFDLSVDDGKRRDIQSAASEIKDQPCLDYFLVEYFLI